MQLSMKALLIHQFGRKTQLIARRLRYENIYCDMLSTQDLQKDPQKDLLLSKLIEANILIAYIQSPNYKDALFFIPEIAKKAKIPIVILDEKDDYKTKGLTVRMGADFYFSQPFSIPTIAMKLKFFLYKKKNLDGAGFLTGNGILLDFHHHMVFHGKNSIDLRNKEFSLLEFFMLNKGKVLTRNAILEHVWDRNTSVLSNTVDVHVARLRQKLGDFNRPKPLIRTIYCVGYCFDSNGTMRKHGNSSNKFAEKRISKRSLYNR